jgi:hypothetical protein
MREHLGFLKASSAVVKVAAWIFLLLGATGGIATFLGLVPNKTRWEGLGTLAIFVFFFFFFYIIAKIADLLIKIINEIHELKKE